MPEQIHSEVQVLMRLAGLQAPAPRLPLLAAGFQLTVEVARALAAVDYGEAEPSSRFRAPAP